MIDRRAIRYHSISTNSTKELESQEKNIYPSARPKERVAQRREQGVEEGKGAIYACLLLCAQV